MKKILVFVSILALCGCVNRYPDKQIIAMSNEKNTDIWLNEEYQGSEYTQLRILNSQAKNSYVVGKKKGCPAKKIKIEYLFDWDVIWIVNPKQLWRLLTWDVWKVDEDKDLYNVTPECE